MMPRMTSGGRSVPRSTASLQRGRDAMPRMTMSAHNAANLLPRASMRPRPLPRMTQPTFIKNGRDHMLGEAEAHCLRWHLCDEHKVRNFYKLQ